jgi:acyl carrier protein
MTNNEKMVQAFAEALQINTTLVTDELQYNSIREWDSVAHMTLVAGLEEAFEIMLDTDDIIEMSSVAKARRIIGKYNVAF